MDLKEQIIQEYLQQGCGYRQLQAKYGIGRTTICKWVQIYQGIHGLQRTHKQQSHYLRDIIKALQKLSNTLTNYIKLFLNAGVSSFAQYMAMKTPSWQNCQSKAIKIKESFLEICNLVA